MSYSSGRYAARVPTIAATCTGTWPATASAAVGTATDLTFVISPRFPHNIAIVGAKIYRTGTGGTFTGVKAILYNGTTVLGTSTAMTFKGTTDELAPITFGATKLARDNPFTAGTALLTATMKLTGTTTASIAATNEILTVVFDTVETFDNTTAR